MSKPEAYAYTDGASSGSRGPGGYGAVLMWKGKTEEISGGEQNTTNQRMELTAACVARLSDAIHSFGDNVTAVPL